MERAFPGAGLQRCKAHFMCNILVHVPKRDKQTFSDLLKLIWQAPNKEASRAASRALRAEVPQGNRNP